MIPPDQPSPNEDRRGWKGPATDIQPFSERAEVRIHTGNLPHWEQSGTTYFNTFRLGDSLPAGKLRELQDAQHAWLHAHGLDDASQLVSLTRVQQRDYHRRFSNVIHQWLDAGSGECTLRRADCRGIVAGALRHADGDDFLLGDFVVMPNHVHLFVKPLGERTLARITQSWKGWSAREINRLLGRRGAFWQEESYDHIVRDHDQWIDLAQYIRRNPVKARLPASDFTLGCGTLGSPLPPL
jgi:REP element-mobilizing transposase RayT